MQPFFYIGQVARIKMHDRVSEPHFTRFDGHVAFDSFGFGPRAPRTATDEIQRRRGKLYDGPYLIHDEGAGARVRFQALQPVHALARHPLRQPIGRRPAHGHLHHGHYDDAEQNDPKRNVDGKRRKLFVPQVHAPQDKKDGGGGAVHRNGHRVHYRVPVRL